MSPEMIFAQHLVNPVLPNQMPVEVTLLRDTPLTLHPDVAPRASFSPGLEGKYRQAPGIRIGFSIHAIADADYRGQWMYVQACRAGDIGAFGDWHYGFYYRGGDSSWDVWELDINHGTTNPGHAAFGQYVDDHLAT